MHHHDREIYDLSQASPHTGKNKMPHSATQRQGLFRVSPPQLPIEVIWKRCQAYIHGSYERPDRLKLEYTDYGISFPRVLSLTLALLLYLQRLPEGATSPFCKDQDFELTHVTTEHLVLSCATCRYSSRSSLSSPSGTTTPAPLIGIAFKNQAAHTLHFHA